jgi:hypothetical protein
MRGAHYGVAADARLCSVQTMRALGVALGDTRVVWLVMVTLRDPHRSVRHIESPHCPEWVDSVTGSPRVG